MIKEQENEIMIDILSDTTAVPNILLESYKEFKLTEKETLFLICIFGSNAQKKSMEIPQIFEELPFTQGDSEKLLAKLVDKGFLCMKKGKISLNCLFDKLREAWGWKEAKLMRLAQEEVMTNKVERESDYEFSSIYKQVEAEFGRPLSPIEIGTVKDWYYEMHMPPELIQEALKRAVLNNKRNFRYIETILLDWQRKKYQSVHDLESDKKPKVKSDDSNKKRKYRENQDVDIFEDIFEVN